MAREVTDDQNIVWTCVEAYAGLHDDAVNREAARAASGAGKVAVVCTPSGAARSVRLELASAWETELSDADLLKAIEHGQ